MTPYTPTTEQSLAARIVAAQREAIRDYRSTCGYRNDEISDRALGVRYSWPEYDVAGTPPTEWPVEGDPDRVAVFGFAGILGIKHHDEALMSAIHTRARRRAAIALLQAQDAQLTRRVRVRWENGAAVAEEVGT